MRFFSPFPHGTVSLSVTQEYLALRGGPRRFTRDFTCPMLLGIHKILEIEYNENGPKSKIKVHKFSSYLFLLLNYRTLTFFGTGLSCFVLKILVCLCPTTLSKLTLKSLGCSHFARRYYGNRFCFLFL
jgi:hypothetical protein